MEDQKEAVQARYLVITIFLMPHSLITRYFLLTGTRGSFVKAFQVFEERELDRLDPSASVKNTMKLHSYKVKNVLAVPQR